MLIIPAPEVSQEQQNLPAVESAVVVEVAVAVAVVVVVVVVEGVALGVYNPKFCFPGYATVSP